jgi:hypothetical protein
MSQDQKPKKRPKKSMIAFAGDEDTSEILTKANDLLLQKSEGNEYLALSPNDKKKKKIPRLGFTQDPVNKSHNNGAWEKRKLLPDEVIKEIRSSDHLIATILRARGNTMSMFGHIKNDRFDVGVVIKIKKEFENIMTPEQQEKVDRRIERAQTLLLNCGYTEGLPDKDKMSLSDYFYLSSYNGLSFGRFATEVIRNDAANDEETGKFNRFRPIDPGTIKPTVMEITSKNEIKGVRTGAQKDLSRQEQVQVEVDTDLSLDYPWVQMIDGKKVEFFSDKEMLVYNLYPSTDVEHNGYPVTPIDTCLSSITTHLSIEAYNKLFFQNGRAAKGMLVVKSDEVDENVLADLKQQFMASINNVSNAFRTPILGVAKDDDVVWTQTDSNGKDGEFEFLYDSISRNILSSFNMSPDELPGYGHLSRATNSQALSESNNEYKLTASRDTGLRPLIMKFQEFINTRLFPAIDPELARICTIELSGLDAQSRDQENQHLTQEAPLHGDMDSILKAVDKEEIGEHAGGKFLFNEMYNLAADKYMTVGEMIQEFKKDPAAAMMTLNRYRRDPFFLQNLQIAAQMNPGAVKAHFATNDMDFEIFQMFIEDMLEEMGD